MNMAYGANGYYTASLTPGTQSTMYKVSFDSAWIYIIGPTIGGILAGMYGVLNGAATAAAKEAEDGATANNGDQNQNNEDLGY